MSDLFGAPVVQKRTPGRIERARRLREHGADYIGNHDLLAAFLECADSGDRQGMAEKLIAECGSLVDLAKLDVDGLCALGLTDSKARLLAAGIEIGRRTVNPPGADRVAIRDPEDIYHLFRNMRNLEREELRVVVMNTKHEVIRTFSIYKGTVCAASVRVAEVLQPAIKLGMPNMIVVHNHPSGDPTPSPEDTAVTRRIRESAEIMDIELLDHVVIAARGFVSMKQRGLGFTS